MSLKKFKYLWVVVGPRPEPYSKPSMFVFFSTSYFFVCLYTQMTTLTLQLQ